MTSSQNDEKQAWYQAQLDELVRDFCSVLFTPKSVLRPKLEALIAEARKRAMQECVSEIHLIHKQGGRNEDVSKREILNVLLLRLNSLIEKQ